MRVRKRIDCILTRMMLLLLAVLLAQMGIYLAVFFGGGMIQDTEENAFSIFNERTANRRLYLENEMVQRWANTREGESAVLAAVRAVLEEHNASIADLRQNGALGQEIVARAAPAVIEMLRRSGMTGAFLVLDFPQDTDVYPGFYVRDYDPTSFTAGNADLLMERGLPDVARENGIAMDSYWSAFFHMPDPTADEAQFYFAPVEAARRADPAHRNAKYYYRWSECFAFSPMDREIVTYSIPLLWEDGTILGVLGGAVTREYLSGQLKYEELDEARMGSYFLGVSRDGGQTYQRVCSSGPNFKAYFGQDEILRTTPTQHPHIVTLAGRGARTLYGAVQPLVLYNRNTPFEGEQWALIGIMDGRNLLDFSAHVQRLLLVSTALSLLIGLVLIFFAARSLAAPVATLANDLKHSDPDKPILLRRIHIAEIDALTDAIEALSNAAAESAARTSKIISMTQIPIGVFEVDLAKQLVFCSQSFCAILNWTDAAGDRYLEKAEFSRRMRQATQSPYERESHVFCLAGADGVDRWIQLYQREEGHFVLGAVQDVTKDIEAKRKMAYERDFDILTDLFNRRAFDDSLAQLFRPEKHAALGIAALLMFDLDNLKYVNDTFGHDCGDRYIQAFAKSLGYFDRCRSVVSRRSGDEFNVFLYGYQTQAEIRTLVADFWEGLRTQYLSLPGGRDIRVRASGGLAWYPADAVRYDELLRLADFAMYNIKHTVKGALQEFDKRDYAEKGILIHGQDDLNRMIESRLVQYAFQPVVSAEDGCICGYELLMRPQIERLKNLGDLFRLAKAESKLYQIEHLTWTEALAAFAQQVARGALDHGELAFINSIGGQRLTDADATALEQQYGALLSRVVIELTESEENGEGTLQYKRQKAQAWGSLLALDDYGTGYNGNAILLAVTPAIVKVDISIIHGIDKDAGKQSVLDALLRFARERGIKVLAEGVETAEELATVLDAGVHYLQGYYLARPAFDPPQIAAAVTAEICAHHCARTQVLAESVKN